MTEAENYFHETGARMQNVKPSKMFGAPCLKTANGKSAAMFYRDCIVVKLSGRHLAAAMGLDGAKLFEPMPGRTMSGWVQIPFAHKADWEKFAKVSAAAVALLPAKK